MNEVNITTKLIELRSNKGITQSELANILGVSNKTISKWECGVSQT